MCNKFFAFIFLAGYSFFSVQASAQSIQFNPDDPIYIEYKAKVSSHSDISVQIEDAKSPAKVRLTLQPKPETTSTFYGYLWLQIGKQMTNEVIIRKSKDAILSGWVTAQDGIQALYLFDSAAEVAEFKNKAALSKKPLTDKAKLPQLAPPPARPSVVAVAKASTSKSIEINNSELGEIAKYAKLTSAYNQFTPEQKKINDTRAAQLAESALKQYKLRNYKVAESQFTESLKLNPTDAMIRYYLAICYYQNKQYDRSLALLALSEGANYNYAEYNYYTGLNQLKLKNYPKALESFDDAKEENDTDYSGPAAFFAGHIYFQKENYSLARQNFEFTIDQSKNPKMDRESEQMLEKIDTIENFRNQINEPFRYTFFAGFGYDSNVLNISTENLATDLVAYRMLYGASANYKFLYDYKNDFSIDLAASDYYSLDSKFKSNATIQSADPLQLSAGLPYHHRFEFGPRIITVGLFPSYQALYMNIDSGGSRKKILDSSIIGTDVSFAVSATYFSRFFLEYAIDKSSIEVASPENAASAKKISLLTTQTFLAASSDKKTYLLDLGYIINEADGDNTDYNKLTAALTFTRSGVWKALNFARLDYAHYSYPHISTNRSDKVGILTLGLTKELTKKLSLTLSALYTMSTSNIDSYKYNKFGAQSLLTYSGAF